MKSTRARACAPSSLDMAANRSDVPTGRAATLRIMAEIREITRLLHEADEGRDGAIDELMAMVYADLERMARSHLKKQFGSAAGNLTIEPAALVNESFMRLIKQRNRYDNRGHFFAIATKMMLRVLIDYRRRRGSLKRGGAQAHITLVLDEAKIAGAGPTPTRGIDIEALAEALERLEERSSRKADVVRMRVVWGLEVSEIAESLGVSTSTVERDWRFAKAWLAEELQVVTDDVAPDAEP